VPVSWAFQYRGAAPPPGDAGNPTRRDQAKRHYRKKCPVFFLVIGFIVLGHRRPVRHNNDTAPPGGSDYRLLPRGSEDVRNWFVRVRTPGQRRATPGGVSGFLLRMRSFNIESLTCGKLSDFTQRHRSGQ